MSSLSKGSLVSSLEDELQFRPDDSTVLSTEPRVRTVTVSRPGSRSDGAEQSSDAVVHVRDISVVVEEELTSLCARLCQKLSVSFLFSSPPASVCLSFLSADCGWHLLSCYREYARTSVCVCMCVCVGLTGLDLNKPVPVLPRWPMK